MSRRSQGRLKWYRRRVRGVLAIFCSGRNRKSPSLIKPCSLSLSLAMIMYVLSLVELKPRILVCFLYSTQWMSSFSFACFLLSSGFQVAFTFPEHPCSPCHMERILKNNKYEEVPKLQWSYQIVSPFKISESHAQPKGTFPPMMMVWFYSNTEAS